MTMLTPAEMLDAAAADIAAGRVQKGAYHAYQAAFAAVADAAQRCGRPCADESDARRFVRHLDGFPPDPADWDCLFDLDRDGENMPTLPEYTAAFNVARSFKEHAETPLAFQAMDGLRYWQPGEYAGYLPVIRELVAKLNAAQTEEESAWIARRI